jgi:AcrR family transcriptional regulator
MKGKSRKERLFEEAARLFMKKGYPATSIRELADVVGIEPSSIYSHIKSKEDLLIKLCMDAAHYFSDGMDSIESSSLTVIEKIDRLIDLHIDAVIELPTSITVFNDEWKHLPKESLQQFLMIRKTYQKKWLSILTTGIKEKTIQDVDPYILRDTILSSLRWIHYHGAEDKSLDMKRIKKDMKSILSHGYSV